MDRAVPEMMHKNLTDAHQEVPGKSVSIIPDTSQVPEVDNAHALL